MEDPWEHDRLGYKAIGETFTNLVKSINDSKVISIEAGFGRGKTFFRKAWSDHLRAAGEVVVEVDAQQSDHSGDALVTLMGALVEAIPREDDGTGQKVLGSFKKYGGIGAKAVAKIVLKSGADELIEAITDDAIDKLNDFDALDSVVNELGEGMSKAAGQFIAAQMAAERVRKKELPDQLEALRSSLTQGKETGRVIVVIDELDRCHPDYAIAVLEAMKLVFNQSGFVFCLMVNADYLEALARHRFGTPTNDEKYLDKFVDIRLGLKPRDETIKSAVMELASDLPLKTPFGESGHFSLQTTAELAGALAVYTALSMRQIKRVLLKVELALRCYSTRPIDAPLLVLLAFEDAWGGEGLEDLLKRSILTARYASEQVESRQKEISNARTTDRDLINKYEVWVRDSFPELLDLPIERYKLPNKKSYYDHIKIFKYLGPDYRRSHEEMLNSVAEILVD
ncbi:KAP family P-loop NTPase fold protein [Sulfitobacter sp.]|uniref:KAP family P-loop NTPase fold protein n=1 Tax=Sulfitobacter sp. TaxID=1903071 RepID=UPI003EF58BD7